MGNDLEENLLHLSRYDMVLNKVINGIATYKF